MKLLPVAERIGWADDTDASSVCGVCQHPRSGAACCKPWSFSRLAVGLESCSSLCATRCHLLWIRSDVREPTCRCCHADRTDAAVSPTTPPAEEETVPVSSSSFTTPTKKVHLPVRQNFSLFGLNTCAAQVPDELL